MRDWINWLYPKSPFGSFREHMQKVHACAALLEELREPLLSGDMDRILDVAKQISQLEHEADEIKNAVRGNLPKTLFLPVQRSDLLDVLSAQDAIADRAEDVGVLATMRPLRWDDELRDLFEQVMPLILQCTEEAHEIVSRLDGLVEVSFGGAEAQRFIAAIDRLNRSEHEADKVQDQLARAVYSRAEDWPAPDFYTWMRMIETLGDVANVSERMGNRLRLFVTN